MDLEEHRTELRSALTDAASIGREAHRTELRSALTDAASIGRV